MRTLQCTGDEDQGGDAINYGRPADPTGLPTILVQFKWNQLSGTIANLNILR